MPTSASYQQAATKLETAATETTSLNNPIEQATAETTAVSGRLGTLVQGVITTTRQETTTISGQFTELSALATTKATSEQDNPLAT